MADFALDDTINAGIFLDWPINLIAITAQAFVITTPLASRPDFAGNDDGVLPLLFDSRSGGIADRDDDAPVKVSFISSSEASYGV